MKSRALQIYGESWYLHLVPAEHPELENAAGRCCFNTRQIFIDKMLSNEDQRTTLLHELIHIVEKRSNLRLSHIKIERVETGFYQILHDNKLRF